LALRSAVLLGCALLAAQGSALLAAARDGDALRVAMLAAHNGERARLGLPPLGWSDALAAEAASNAATLAAAPEPALSHVQTNGGKPRGENLWLGTRGAFTFDEMAQSWLEERDLYVDGAVPEISSSGNWADVGHYSQMIWRSTREVGCALSSSAEVDLLICRYDPAGNIHGRNALTGERAPDVRTAPRPAY